MRSRDLSSAKCGLGGAVGFCQCPCQRSYSQQGSLWSSVHLIAKLNPGEAKPWALRRKLGREREIVPRMPPASACCSHVPAAFGMV